jgi:DNA-binding ferritin-like protein
MKTRRLVESFEFNPPGARPAQAFSVGADNLMSAWGSVEYGELSLLLVNMRALVMIHQTNHWISKGNQFYGDHLLFQRLYEESNDEIDSIAEKAIGLGGPDNVNLPLQAQQVNEVLQSYGPTSTIPQAGDLAKRSLTAEVSFLRCVAHCVDSLNEHGLMTRGLDNMLAGIEDTHEGHVYLLKQRCKG